MNPTGKGESAFQHIETSTERETNILHVALRGPNLGGRPRPKNQIDAMVEADGHVH